jgi:ketosteroid isomerase-like protein
MVGVSIRPRLRDTPRVMSEPSTTPDLAELARRAFEALSRRDFEALESFYAPDAVLKLVTMGASFEGVAAIRGFCEDFVATFEEYEIELEEILDLGNGVGFGVYLQQGRPVGSSGRVQMRAATVFLRAEGLVVRHMMYTDVDEGRAAAERLAEERE